MTGVERRPSVSVVIPTHGRPEFLRRAVGSVLDQEYTGRIEALVVFDDCKPVDVPEPSSADRAVVLLGNDRMPGPLGARNAGILAAKGDILAFLDDDDEWVPSKLARQVEVLMSGSAEVVFSGVRFVARDRYRDYVPALPADDPVRGLVGGGIFMPIQTMIVWRRICSTSSFRPGVTKSSCYDSCSGCGRNASPSRWCGWTAPIRSG
jgi:glycosyltransferase involved in cell wall biosynthesis